MSGSVISRTLNIPKVGIKITDRQDVGKMTENAYLHTSSNPSRQPPEGLGASLRG
jgi:hypothetical protein